MSVSICHMSASQLSLRIRQGDLSPVEVTEAFLARIDEHDARINAYRTVFHEWAREQAREAERAVDDGAVLGPLHGVPVAIKDNADIAGESTAAGKKPLLNHPVEHDSIVVERLREAGAILLGKTHMPELGYGTTDLSWGEPTSTPFDLDRNSGGSSGGSAAAVAAGMAPLALGTDGGGSIRIPASWCGLYGIKPTFRRVPRTSTTGRNAFKSIKPFSEFGPLARSVEDAALMLDVIAGPHAEDVFTLPDDETDYLGSVLDTIDGLDVAFSPDLDIFPVAGEVREIVTDAIPAFERVGATVEETEIGSERPQTELCATWMAWVDVSRATSAELLKRDGIDLLGAHRDELHPELVESIERGREWSAVEHSLIDAVRTEVAEAVRSTFDRYDLLVAPTLAVPPVENADDGYTVGPSEVDDEAVDPHLGWCLTYPFNFTGHPAASIPAGFTDDGLPVGLQIVGPRFAEDRVLAASAAFERVRPWTDSYPSL